jgi:hypothetical protein
MAATCIVIEAEPCLTLGCSAMAVAGETQCEECAKAASKNAPRSSHRRVRNGKRLEDRLVELEGENRRLRERIRTLLSRAAPAKGTRR